jgi:hypothetical protein
MNRKVRLVVRKPALIPAFSPCHYPHLLRELSNDSDDATYSVGAPGRWIAGAFRGGTPFQSARGLAQPKTLARSKRGSACAKRPGVRAALRRFRFVNGEERVRFVRSSEKRQRTGRSPRRWCGASEAPRARSVVDCERPSAAFVLLTAMNGYGSCAVRKSARGLDAVQDAGAERARLRVREASWTASGPPPLSFC